MDMLKGKIDKEDINEKNQTSVGMLEAVKNSDANNYVFQNLLEEDKVKNIILRNDGLYMGRKQINGKRVSVYARTYAECLKKLKQTRQILKKISQKHEDKDYMLYEWLAEWYETYKMRFVSLDTSNKINRVIREIKNYFKNQTLKSLKTLDIQKFLNTYPTSRKKEFITLYFNACLQKAEDLNMIDKNPFKAVVKEKRLNNIREGYSLEEQKTILKEIKGTELEPVILFYLVTGIRKDELKTFNIETDINEKTKTIKIKSEKKRDSKNLFREIDVTEELIALVKNNKESFKLDTNYIYRELKKILDKNKIKSGLHRLRHTFATNHFYLGTPVKMVSAWLGHETVELTQNIYTHIDRSITKSDVLALYANLYFLPK